MSKALEQARELVKILEEMEAKEGNESKALLSSLHPGDTFKIGEHDFIVLEQSNGQTKVISKGLMAEEKNFDEDTNDYGKSSIKDFIESEIQPIVEKEVGAENLIEHEVDLTSVDMQEEFEPCRCKVRLITFDEAREYNGILVNDDFDDWWWTCTPWSTPKRGWSYSVAVVSPSGNFNGDFCFSRYGVRPVCILKSNIFVSKGE